MKEKRKINFIDIIILLCVAIIIASAFFRTQIIQYIADGKNLSTYSVSFESDPVENGYISYIKTGNSVEWVEKNMTVGTVGALEAPTPATVYTLTSSGVLTSTPSDTTSTVRGSLSILAADNDGCFVSGTEFIGAGMKMTLRTGNAVFTVTVLSVTKV